MFPKTKLYLFPLPKIHSHFNGIKDCCPLMYKGMFTRQGLFPENFRPDCTQKKCTVKMVCFLQWVSSISMGLISAEAVISPQKFT